MLKNQHFTVQPLISIFAEVESYQNDQHHILDLTGVSKLVSDTCGWHLIELIYIWFLSSLLNNCHRKTKNIPLNSARWDGPSTVILTLLTTYIKSDKTVLILKFQGLTLKTHFCGARHSPKWSASYFTPY